MTGSAAHAGLSGRLSQLGFCGKIQQAYGALKLQYSPLFFTVLKPGKSKIKVMAGFVTPWWLLGA